MAACFAGEPSEMSKGLELGLFCLAGHISSRGPGVGGVETVQSAGIRSTAFGDI
jgi:hypothetical protein